MSNTTSDQGKRNQRPRVNRPPPVYLDKSYTKKIVNGELDEVKYYVIDGHKGLSFKYFRKTNDHVQKCAGREMSNGTFNVYQKQDQDSKKNNMTLEELSVFIQGFSELEFVASYLKVRPGKQTTNELENVAQEEVQETNEEPPKTTRKSRRRRQKKNEE